MSKPAAPRKQAQGSEALKPHPKIAKPTADSPVSTGRRSRYPPPQFTPEHVLSWEPCVDWKEVMYMKNLGQGRIYEVGETMGIRGNRRFIGYLPCSGQQINNIYRPLGWWL